MKLSFVEAVSSFVNVSVAGVSNSTTRMEDDTTILSINYGVSIRSDQSGLPSVLEDNIPLGGHSYSTSV